MSVHFLPLNDRYVVNYDFPRNIEDYVHRVGRTGRAGWVAWYYWVAVLYNSATGCYACIILYTRYIRIYLTYTQDYSYVYSYCIIIDNVGYPCGIRVIYIRTHSINHSWSSNKRKALGHHYCGLHPCTTCGKTKQVVHTKLTHSFSFIHPLLCAVKGGDPLPSFPETTGNGQQIWSLSWLMRIR